MLQMFFFYTHMLPLLFSIHNQFLIKTFKYLESKVFHLYLGYKKHKFIFLLETSSAASVIKKQYQIYEIRLLYNF